MEAPVFLGPYFVYAILSEYPDEIISASVAGQSFANFNFLFIELALDILSTMKKVPNKNKSISGEMSIIPCKHRGRDLSFSYF